MKLKRRFLPQQLLSAFLAILIYAGSAQAQERIVMKDGRTQDVKIVGVSGNNLTVQIGAGSVGIPLATIAQVVMPAPADFAAAVKAFSDKNYPAALVKAKAVADKYKGLPAEWAQQATAMIGDIYAAMNDIPKAEAAYRDYQKAYPGSGSVQTDLGLSKLAILKKDFATAKAKLEPIAEAALREKLPTAVQASVFGQAFFLLGQLHEAQGDKAAALESYLRTVTIFNHDRLAAASARQRADALTQENPALTVP